MEALAQRCGELHKALKQDKTSLETRAVEDASQKAELEGMVSKLSELHKSVQEFDWNVAEAGFRLDEQFVATLSKKIIDENTALQSAQKTLSNLEPELTIVTNRINLLEQKRDQQAEARKRASSAILPLDQQIVVLRAKAEAYNLSLEMAPDKLAAETDAYASRKDVAEKCIRDLTPQIEKLTQTINKTDRQITELKERIGALYQDKVRLEEEIRRYEEEAVTVVDRNAIKLHEISEKRKLADERVDQLDSLRRRCLTLERFVDASHRSAMLADLEAQAQKLVKEKKALIERADRMSVVMKWFTSVKDALDKQSSSAVSNHVDAFGPLTTLIQKRLRAVYGFGDISLIAKGNEIHVEVSWDGKRVTPADYFSDSQKQILMLSLFLAGRLTQTWSGFAPILMDDPVTHFDDLNVFGFIELIRGLINTSPGKRQFFISTCEDRLFDLMLKKFNNVDGGAKFFRFEGIGPNGPVIRKQTID